MKNLYLIHTMLLLAFLTGGSVAANAQSKSAIVDQYSESAITPDTITINPSGMPLVTAVERLEEIYGVPITYEDTKYVGENEVGEVALANNAVAKTITRRISMVFNYEAPPPDAPLDIRKKLAASALSEAVQNYNNQRNGEIFTVTEDAAGFHVVARKFSGTSTVEDMRPLLDTPITISAGTRTVDQLLTEICKAIPTLTLGTTPTNLFMQHETTVSASNTPARVVLENMLKEIPISASKEIARGKYKDTAEGGYLTWELRTSPDPRWGSALNFRIVKPPGTL